MWDEVCDLTNENAQYFYCANGAPALLFTIFFTIVFSVHLYQCLHYKAKYCWVICMASAWEAVGFLLRTVSTANQIESTTATPAGLLVLLAPLWVNAFDYVVFGRMIWYYLPDKKIAGIRAQKMATCFVWLDVVAFLIQATGGILDQGTDQGLITIALWIYMAGIAIQQCFILCFVSLAIQFHRKMLSGAGIPERGTKWKTLMYGLYATLALITLRIIYRLVEFSGGRSNVELTTHEAYFYVLEAVPMLFAMTLWSVFHPGRILVGPEALFPKKAKLSKEEKKERKQQKKDEKERAKMEKKMKKDGKRRQGDSDSLESDQLPMHNVNLYAPKQSHGVDQYGRF